MSYDAAELYDEAVDIIKQSLDGKPIDAVRLDAAYRVMQSVFTMIYLERSRGQFPSQIEDKDE